MKKKRYRKKYNHLYKNVEKTHKIWENDSYSYHLSGIIDAS